MAPNLWRSDRLQRTKLSSSNRESSAGRFFSKPSPQPDRLLSKDTRRAAAIYTLIETAKLNDTDPLAWLADVLARLQGHPARRIDELLPWHWKTTQLQKAAA